MFELEKTKASTWSKLDTTSIAGGATIGLHECAAICLKKGVECDIFKFSEETKMCSYAQVSKANQGIMPKRWISR
jgi:hypothetical protein